MHHFRVVIAYKGTHYFGWQDLGQHTTKPTIQATIHRALLKISNYQDCVIAAASRTDAGVHAQGQVAKISMTKNIAANKLLDALNSQLPNDIRILNCQECHVSFNANKDSQSKEYHYYFTTEAVCHPLIADVITHLPNRETALDVQLMQRGCQLFLGEHDFFSFATRDKRVASTVRTIKHCELTVVESPMANQPYYALKITGNGFLKQMVRFIAGALFALGRHQITLAQIQHALKHRQDHKMSAKAKPHGLHLIKINSSSDASLGGQVSA